MTLAVDRVAGRTTEGVVEPTGGVAVGKRFIPVGCHRDLVAVGVVGVVDGVGGSMLDLLSSIRIQLFDA